MTSCDSLVLARIAIVLLATVLLLLFLVVLMAIRLRLLEQEVNRRLGRTETVLRGRRNL